MRRCFLVMFVLGTLSAAHSMLSPALGFLVKKGSPVLEPVLGVPGAARAGNAITVTGAAALFVAPGGRWALALDAAGAVEYLSLRPDSIENGLVLAPVEGALPSPDLVTFSPSGTAAVLYSRQNRSLQAVSLSGTPRAHSAVSITDNIRVAAVSDDAARVLAISDSGALIGGTLQTAAGAAIAFAPQSQDAFVADEANARVLRVDAGGQVSNAASLQVCSDHQAIVVASDGTVLISCGKSMIAAHQGQPTAFPLSGEVDTLQQLSARDTFLAQWSDGDYGILLWRNGKLTEHFIAVRN